MVLKVKIYEVRSLNKEFWKSMTFWGALGWGIVVFLEGLTVEFPVVLPFAKGLSSLLVVFGIRRAIK